MYDLVVRDGVVVDGSGMPRYRADVAVQDGHIAAVGRVRDQGRRELDAEGNVVTPGFIDGHTHFDAQVNWDPLGTSSCWHGVTTVVMGNCGFTLAPVRSGQREYVLRNLERAEDIPRESLGAGIDWQWQTFPEYLDDLERRPKGINYAVNVGHSALRTWAMGERAFEDQATETDLQLMERQLRGAIGAGAIGFTTSWASSHALPDGRPVASRISAWNETERLVGVTGEARHALFEVSLPKDHLGADPEQDDVLYRKMRSLALATGTTFMFGLTAGRNADDQQWRRTPCSRPQMQPEAE
jgi:N-acyl-D-aspartate/D-glutamate deacylase